MPAIIAPWVLWLALAIGGGLVYQMGMKLVSTKIPLGVYYLTSSAVLLVAGLVMLKFHPQKVTLGLKDITSLLIIAAVACSVVAIDLGYFNMYKTGAPVAISRTIATASLAVLMLLAGILVFKENPTTQQYLGIAVTMLGMLLITWKF